MYKTQMWIVAVSAAMMAIIATVAGVEVSYAQYQVGKAVADMSQPAASKPPTQQPTEEPSADVTEPGDENHNNIPDGSLAGGDYCTSLKELGGYDPDC